MEVIDRAVPEDNLGAGAMSEAQKNAKGLVEKMRTNTEHQNRKTTTKLWRQSRKKVQKNRQKKS
jgi:hypothetical protein